MAAPMTAESADGIILRSTPFSETSCVVTIFTRQFGKLRALAKGAWRPKSAFDAALDLLSVCHVLVLRKSSGGLDLLTEARLEQRFRCDSTILAFYGGMYVAELVDALTADADPHPELFDAVSRALFDLSSSASIASENVRCGFIDNNTSSEHRAKRAEKTDYDYNCARARIVQAELEILRLSGHGASFSRCAECQASLELHRRVAFGMLDGGSLCQNCRAGKRSIVSLSQAAAGALVQLESDPQCFRTISMDDRTTGEIRAVMNTYISGIAGRKLKTAAFLNFRYFPRSHQT